LALRGVSPEAREMLITNLEAGLLSGNVFASTLLNAMAVTIPISLCGGLLWFPVNPVMVVGIPIFNPADLVNLATVNLIIVPTVMLPVALRNRALIKSRLEALGLPVGRDFVIKAKEAVDELPLQESFGFEVRERPMFDRFIENLWFRGQREIPRFHLISRLAKPPLPKSQWLEKFGQVIKVGVLRSLSERMEASVINCRRLTNAFYKDVLRDLLSL